MSDKIKVIKNFEGSMILDYTINDNNVNVEIVKEKPTIFYSGLEADYNLHFNFGIKNLAKKSTIIFFSINLEEESELVEDELKIWTKSSDDKLYVLRRVEGLTNFKGSYKFSLELGAGELLYISNFYPVKFSIIQEKFKHISNKVNFREKIIGYTVDNRPLIAYESFSDVSKPTIMVVSGFHPPESDFIASEGIMEAFLVDNFRKKVLGNFNVCFIPIMNPDGYANCFQGSNLNHINFHWKFFNNGDKCPESTSIWKYCTEIKPNIFFDFHSYTFQNKEPSCYFKPSFFYHGKENETVVKIMNEKIKKRCNGFFNNKKNSFIPGTLHFKLTEDYNTITFAKFHLHMAKGVESSKILATDCFEDVVDVLLSSDIKKAKDMLIYPHGRIKKSFSKSIRIKSHMILNWKLKPLIKTFLRT